MSPHEKDKIREWIAGQLRTNSGLTIMSDPIEGYPERAGFFFRSKTDRVHTLMPAELPTVGEVGEGGPELFCADGEYNLQRFSGQTNEDLCDMLLVRTIFLEELRLVTFDCNNLSSWVRKTYDCSQCPFFLTCTTHGWDVNLPNQKDPSP